MNVSQSSSPAPVPTHPTGVRIRLRDGTMLHVPRMHWAGYRSGVAIWVSFCSHPDAVEILADDMPGADALCLLVGLHD